MFLDIHLENNILHPGLRYCANNIKYKQKRRGAVAFRLYLEKNL